MSESYTYDPAGNMLTRTAKSVKTRYTYNAANQLVSDGTNDYTYDKVGSLLKKQSYGGSVSYAYNARNLLESWTDGEHSESCRYNAATGMVYFRARFYEPEMNRFSQKDILRGNIINPQTLNRYVYCINDPVNFIDPSGMRLVENDPREVRSDLIVPTGRAGTSGPSTNTNVSAKSAAQTAQNVRVQTRLEAIDERDSGSNSPKQLDTDTPIIECTFENETGSCNSQNDRVAQTDAVEEALKNHEYLSMLLNCSPIGFSGGFGITGEASASLAVDLYGNIYLIGTVGAGGGMGVSGQLTDLELAKPGFSVGLEELFEDSFNIVENVDELEGWGTSIGSTIGVVSINATTINGEDAELSTALTGIGLEFHANITYSFTIKKFEVDIP